MDEQIDHSTSDPDALARRLGMKKPLQEMTYAEQVAAFCENHGALDGLGMVTAQAAYVAQAEGWGMAPAQCAKNVMRRVTGRDS